jgi:zinc transport system substrate-binding protein
MLITMSRTTRSALPIPRSLALCVPLLALASLGLVACGNADEGSSSGGPQVVASSYPFAFVLERVGGDLVDVQNLTAPGAEPHDLELSPRQVADLSEADLVVYEDGFQPAVDDALAEADLPVDSLLDVAMVAGAEATGFSTEHGDEETHGDAEEHSDAGEHADQNATEGGEEHAEGTHGDEELAVEEDADELDPHVWLDPLRMLDIAAAVEERLIAADPDNAPAYRDNAAALAREVRRLDQDFTEGLARCERRTIVTGHAAFAYLADRYDLTQIAIAGIDPHAEPSPVQQAEVADLVEQEGITTVFTEALVPPDVAESIADETGVTVSRLDPIEGLSDETSDETYVTLMHANLAAIQDANGCS